MFVFDTVLDVALAPSLARAADIFELLLNSDESLKRSGKRWHHPLMLATRNMWRDKIEALCQGQNYMSADRFWDEAELIAYQRIEERKGLIRERFRIKQERLEQRSLELMQEAREENLIRMGVYA